MVRVKCSDRRFLWKAVYICCMNVHDRSHRRPQGYEFCRYLVNELHSELASTDFTRASINYGHSQKGNKNTFMHHISEVLFKGEGAAGFRKATEVFMQNVYGMLQLVTLSYFSQCIQIMHEAFGAHEAQDGVQLQELSLTNSMGGKRDRTSSKASGKKILWCCQHLSL